MGQIAVAPEGCRREVCPNAAHGRGQTVSGNTPGAALGIAAIDAVRAHHAANGTEQAELSWILEDNTAIKGIIEGLNAKPYKRYRIYERAL